MYDAILSSEDPRYYQHGGVDLIGTTRAVISATPGGGETQGGSSISQQYVKNVLIQRCERDAEYETDRRRVVLTRRPGRSSLAGLRTAGAMPPPPSGNDGIQRKLQEMRYAIALEQKYSKNDILLGYLNIANFGGRTYGIDAAARYYFGVAAKDLILGQAATLAGIVQNPNIYRIDQPGSISMPRATATTRPRRSIDDVNKGSSRARHALTTARSRRSSTRGATATRDQGAPALRAQPHARRRQDHAGAVRRRRHRSRSPR